MTEQYRLTVCKIILNSTIYWPKHKVRFCSVIIRISICQNDRLLMMHCPRDRWQLLMRTLSLSLSLSLSGWIVTAEILVTYQTSIHIAIYHCNLSK